MNNQRPLLFPVPSPERMVTLAQNFEVELDCLLTNRMVGFGLPNSGKTNLVALIAEQIGQYSIPLVVFDWEGDFLSLKDALPRGIVATVHNCPTGRDILTHGLQVVFDLSSWGTADESAVVMCDTVKQLMDYEDTLPPLDRIPCPIFLDEAHKWLPERRGNFISEDNYKSLQDTFLDLGSRGRKRGLTSALFAQRISLLSKSVMFPGVYFLLKQSLHADLNMYMQYVNTGDLTEKQVKTRIAAFPTGKGIVTLPGGKQRTVIFNLRQSEHISHTPKADVAINKFAAMPFDANMSFGSFMAGEELAPAAPEKPVTKVEKRVTKQPTKKAKGKNTRNNSNRIERKVKACLKANPDASLVEIAEYAGCSRRTAFNKRKALRDGIK